jgi:hypothetical protein
MDAGMKLGNTLAGYPFTVRSSRGMRQRRSEAALPYAEWAGRFLPMSWRVQARLAESCHRTGQTERARQALGRVRRLDPRRYDGMSRSLGLTAD